LENLFAPGRSYGLDVGGILVQIPEESIDIYVLQTIDWRWK